MTDPSKEMAGKEATALALLVIVVGGPSLRRLFLYHVWRAARGGGRRGSHLDLRRHHAVGRPCLHQASRTSSGQQRLPVTLKELLSGRPKIVARTKSGKCLKGYLRDGRVLITRGILRMTTVDSQELPVDLNQLKGVFFVRDFDGNKHRLENKVLLSDPERPGIRVRLRFEDNETMEGVIENGLDLLPGQRFLLLAGRSRGQQRFDLRYEVGIAWLPGPRRQRLVGG